jgi:hypothetical protein
MWLQEPTVLVVTNQVRALGQGSVQNILRSYLEYTFRIT